MVVVGGWAGIKAIFKLNHANIQLTKILIK